MLAVTTLFMCLIARGQDTPRVLPITGTVVDTTGQPIQGATVSIIGTSIQTQTDKYGRFSLRSALGKSTLRVRFVGYHTAETSFTSTSERPLQFVLRPLENVIEEVEINAGYYTVSDRELTGNIGRIDATKIARQPVSNPLSTLAGQIAGVEVTQQSGAPGAFVSLRIRGQNSLLNGTDPLFIIDGVPFITGQQPINQLENISSQYTVTGTTAGISPLNSLNPADIVSIEILKDADATAIYGSRGANGVVLITTHKGGHQPLKLNVGYRTGLSRPTRMVQLLSGSEYLAMRREAFHNDGIETDFTNAPDLTLWDTTQAVDYMRALLPERARYNDVQLTFRGGTPAANFLISGNYHSESTVFNRNTANQRFAVHTAGGLASPTGKLKATGSFSLSNTSYDMLTQDITRFIRFFPFAPLYTDYGKLAWDISGTPYTNIGYLDGNPLAMHFRKYDANSMNLTGQASIIYEMSPQLQFKTNMGSNLLYNNEWNATPSASLDPFSRIQPNASFADSRRSGWIIEPQMTYQAKTTWLAFSALIGGTWQHQHGNSRTSHGTDYTNDLLLRTIGAAGNISSRDQANEYRYQGFYLRLNGNFKNRYIVNLTGRRDGSSRFSPENRYNNFAAIGAAWLIDMEPFMEWAGWLDLAKARASYGITGNDQIGDYRYLDTWNTGSYRYQGSPVMNPVSLYNPNYVWERNRKVELAFESRMFENRTSLQIVYYHNISDNQLIQYTLPIQTGFADILQNQQASILNSGVETQLGYQSPNSPSHWQWSTSINVTFPKNKILDFPNLATSSYRFRYVIGESVTTRLGYQYIGVNPDTGLYDFTDVDDNGRFNTVDAVFPVRRDMRFYGGWNNAISYKSWSLATTVDFKKQDGYNYLYSATTPGYDYLNQPIYALRRWRQEGDVTTVQRFTASRGDAYERASLLRSSAGVISDASFVRLRNLSLSYGLPKAWIDRVGLASCRASLQAQNLLTLTRYEGTDPESQSFYTLPPLRTVTFSIELEL